MVFKTQEAKDLAIVAAKKVVADTTGQEHKDAVDALAETKDAEVTS